MEQAVSAPSPALLAANEYLLKLRAEAQAQRQTAVSPADPAAEGRGVSVTCLDGIRDASSDAAACPSVPPLTSFGQELSEGTDRSASAEPPSILDFIANLPLHLGWGSEPLVRALRQTQVRTETDVDTAGAIEERPVGSKVSDANQGPTTGLRQAPAPSSSPTKSLSVKLYPDIGLAMLREEQTAAGRLWLLLRGLDEEGQGWLYTETVRELLTKKSSDTHLCGWRQLRNLLREGDGTYWTRDTERIWLRSAGNVALSLGVVRLTGQPVMLPLEALVNGIGRFRAELYAAFHSSRSKTAPDGTEQAAPIARETLTELSGVGETTQRRYEEETAVHVRSNYAIGNRATPEEIEDKAWQHGNAVFTLEDTRGQQGPKGREYVAWQLPNSYEGNHQQCPKGRQRRINRQLRDLVMKGMPGNVEQTIEASAMRDKLYYPTGKLAAQAFNKGKVKSCYWRQPATVNSRFDKLDSNGHAIWQHLAQGQRRRVENHG
jgi:hypothetical protein